MQTEMSYNKDVFAENLRALMKMRGERQTYIARLLGVSRASVSAYCGGEQMPRMDKLQRLSGHFGVALRELIEERAAGAEDCALSPADAIYTRLDAEGRRELLRYGRKLLAGSTAQIKHYTVPAAAGYAAPVAGEDYELLDRSALTPDGADFCITVHGDSMAPYISDGELVYIRRDAPLEEFDVGIFYVDGDVFCKQWCVDYSGTLHLLSANPLRQSANISIPRDCGRSCVCFGKVLLPQRLPRPSYLER